MQYILTFHHLKADTYLVNEAYIYIVGQPDPQSGTVDAIHTLGYKAGIFIDTHLELKHPEQYDHIEPVDFNTLDSELVRLSALELNVAGLMCTYENYVVAKAKLGALFKVPAPSIESARLATDKSLMRRAFLDYDTTISPDFSSINSVEEAVSFARSHTYPLIIKPTNLVKSLLVLRCDNEDELIKNVQYAKETITKLYDKYHIYERAPQLIIEEFIVGKQCSIAAFVDKDGAPHFCDGIVALTNAQDIDVSDNYLYCRTLPANIEDSLQKEMFRVAKAGVKALKMQSVPAHIELMYGPDGVKIIEIGARIGGYRPRMYHYSYGVDLIEQEVKLAIGEAPELKGTFKEYCAVYELFPDREGEFNKVTGNPVPEEFTYYRETAKPGTVVGPAKNGYKAAAIIIVTSADATKFESLKEKVDNFSIEVL